jgi:hypothetical protein
MPSMTFTDKLNRVIDIKFDEDQLTCEAHDHGSLIGTFCFIEANPDEDSCLLLLTHCHLEEIAGYTGCGIGEKMLRLPIDFGYSIFARQNDGITREDGSHLTEDAPAFISAMFGKGLVRYMGSGIDYDNYHE